MNLENKIAVIGMHGRFPKSPSLESFWNNLKEGRELISFFSDHELESIKDSFEQLPNYVKAKGYLDHAEYFDAPFFGYTSREAEFMDPQQRVLLESAWHALENAGYDPHQYSGKIGVFVGSSISTYLMFNVLPYIMKEDWYNPYVQSITMTGNDKDFLATRLSYKLNLKGPSKTIQTACSTSLVAVHDACQNLLDYSCDMALAGGVSITCPLKGGYLFFKEGINSPDGHCRAFDEQAQGTLIGNGVGLVVLKRLEDAIKDRDHISAVILGSAINNDGNRKLGYTAPSIEGQSEVISEAFAMSGVNPETITYVEAHGTGTIIGDPVEVKALTKAFRVHTKKNQFCCLGSLKTNIGHLDAAAGVAGLIKVILSLKHGVIPPTVHFSKPNPELNLETTPFYINNKPQDWKTGHIPPRASISSFGIGGTNAHVIMERYREESYNSIVDNAESLITLSAQTPQCLKKIKENLIDYFQRDPQRLCDVSFTINTGRKQQVYRTFLTCKNVQEVTEKLKSSLVEDVEPLPPIIKSIVWIFPNFEESCEGFNEPLMAAYPSIKQNIDLCFENFRLSLERDEFNLLSKQKINDLLHHPAVINFAAQYSLSKLLQELGCVSEQLIGIGLGLYVGAVIAKILTLEAAIMCISSWLKEATLKKDEVESMILSDSSIPLFSPMNFKKHISSRDLLDVNFWISSVCEIEKPIPLDFLTSTCTALSFHAGIPKDELFSYLSPKTLTLKDDRSFLENLGQLWKEGYISKWRSLYQGGDYRHTALPGYPFEKIRYWISAEPNSFREEKKNDEQQPFIPTVDFNPANESPNALEESLIEIWKQSFNNPNINLEDKFNQIGGDSLIALELKGLIFLRFYVDVPLRVFFDNPTIKYMASFIHQLLLENINNFDEKQLNQILMYLENNVT